MRSEFCPECGEEMKEENADAFAGESYWVCPKCKYEDVIPWGEDEEEDEDNGVEE